MNNFRRATKEKVINAIKVDFFDCLSLYKIRQKTGVSYNVINAVIEEIRNGGDTGLLSSAGGSAPFPQHIFGVRR